MDSEYLKLLGQLDLACLNRDLSAARRLSYKLSESIVGAVPDIDPPDLMKLESVFRVYAAEIHGWEIDHAK